MPTRRERRAAVVAMLTADPTRSTDSIADEAGVNACTVRRIRAAIGLPAPPRSPTPTAAVADALGRSASDREAGDRIGVGVHVVRIARVKQGIPSRHRAVVADRHADILARVERGHNDSEIARDIGMSIAGVRAVRVKAGLPPNFAAPRYPERHRP